MEAKSFSRTFTNRCKPQLNLKLRLTHELWTSYLMRITPSSSRIHWPCALSRMYQASWWSCTDLSTTPSRTTSWNGHKRVTASLSRTMRPFVKKSFLCTSSSKVMTSSKVYLSCPILKWWNKIIIRMIIFKGIKHIFCPASSHPKCHKSSFRWNANFRKETRHRKSLQSRSTCWPLSL